MKRFRPVILVTIGWCALYFCFLQGQAAAAFWIHKKRRNSFSNKKVDDPPASSPGVAHLAQARPRAHTSLALSMPPCLVHVTSLQKSGTPALRLTLHDSHRCILRTQNSGASIPFAAVKYGPRAEVQPGLIFVMDRTVGNLLEQTPPFLLGLWLHAMAASPEVAARLAEGLAGEVRVARDSGGVDLVPLPLQ